MTCPPPCSFSLRCCWASPPYCSALPPSFAGHVDHQNTGLDIRSLISPLPWQQTLSRLPSTFDSLLRCYPLWQWPTSNLQFLLPSCLRFQSCFTEIVTPGWFLPQNLFSLFALMPSTQLKNLTTPTYTESTVSVEDVFSHLSSLPVMVLSLCHKSLKFLSREIWSN